MTTAISPVQEANFVFDFGEVLLLRTFALAEHLGFPCHSDQHRAAQCEERTGVLFGTTSSRVHCNSGQVKTPKSDIWNSQNHHSYCNQWVIYSSDNVSSQLKGFHMHRGNHSCRCRHPTHSGKKAWATWLRWEAVRQAKTYQSKKYYQKLCYLGDFLITVKLITYHKLIWWK